MATETATDRRASHLRSITVTTVATLGGILAGVVAAALASSPTDQIGIAVVAGFALAELGVLYALGVDVMDFSTKDNLYVFFMTVSMWYITWGILLSSHVSI